MLNFFKKFFGASQKPFKAQQNTSHLSDADEAFLSQLEKDKVQEPRVSSPTAEKPNIANTSKIAASTSSSLISAQQTSASTSSSSISVQQTAASTTINSSTSTSSRHPTAPQSILDKPVPPINNELTSEQKELLRKITYLGGLLGLTNDTLAFLDNHFAVFWNECPNGITNLKALKYDKLASGFEKLNKKEKEYVVASMRKEFSSETCIGSYVNQFNCIQQLFIVQQHGWQGMIKNGKDIQEEALQKQLQAIREREEEEAVNEALAFIAQDSIDEEHRRAIEMSAQTLPDDRNAVPENPLNVEYEAKVVRLRRELQLLLGNGEEVPVCLDSIQRHVNWGPTLPKHIHQQTLNAQFTILDNYKRSTKSYTKEGLMAFVNALNVEEDGTEKQLNRNSKKNK